MIYAAAMVWWLVGLACFVYWWTSEFDLTRRDLLFGCLPALLGPFGWLMGWAIHGKRKPSRVLVTRRSRA